MKVASTLLLLIQTLALAGVPLHGGPISPESVLAKMRGDNYLGALEDLETLLRTGGPDPRLYYQKGICETVLVPRNT